MSNLITHVLSAGLKETIIKDFSGKEWICKLKQKTMTPCGPCCGPPQPLPCLDRKYITIDRARQCHYAMICKFLYGHYWSREPSTTGLYLPLTSPYLSYLTNKYATQGDRLVLFQESEDMDPKKQKMIGFAVGDKAFRWTPDELETWAACNIRCKMQTEADHMNFIAMCMRGADLCNKYNVPYVYDLQALGVTDKMTRCGLGTFLFQALVLSAMELRHPLIQVIATNEYMARMCEKAGFKREWSIQYKDVTDMKGRYVFYPRKPHLKVIVYSRKFDPYSGAVPDRCKDPDLYETYIKLISRPQPEVPKPCLTHH